MHMSLNALYNHIVRIMRPIQCPSNINTRLSNQVFRFQFNSLLLHTLYLVMSLSPPFFADFITNRVFTVVSSDFIVVISLFAPFSYDYFIRKSLNGRSYRNMALTEITSKIFIAFLPAYIVIFCISWITEHTHERHFNVRFIDPEFIVALAIIFLAAYKFKTYSRFYTTNTTIVDKNIQTDSLSKANDEDNDDGTHINGSIIYSKTFEYIVSSNDITTTIFVSTKTVNGGKTTAITTTTTTPKFTINERDNNLDFDELASKAFHASAEIDDTTDNMDNATPSAPNKSSNNINSDVSYTTAEDGGTTDTVDIAPISFTDNEVSITNAILRNSVADSDALADNLITNDTNSNDCSNVESNTKDDTYTSENASASSNRMFDISVITPDVLSIDDITFDNITTTDVTTVAEASRKTASAAPDTKDNTTVSVTSAFAENPSQPLLEKRKDKRPENPSVETRVIERNTAPRTPSEIYHADLTVNPLSNQSSDTEEAHSLDCNLSSKDRDVKGSLSASTLQLHTPLKAERIHNEEPTVAAQNEENLFVQNDDSGEASLYKTCPFENPTRENASQATKWTKAGPTNSMSESMAVVSAIAETAGATMTSTPLVRRTLQEMLYKH